ncbi:MAG TPA: IPT/TIG domain-containing protein [Candidatus Angelobacter sp.]|jgi:YD repeat-containing protein|nr:IPT/TIG domain-containing protein [Candidatus Angelobacter sp.]
MPGHGQGTTQYIYDANGRLTGVITPSGDAAVYHYDAAGNITSIERLGAGSFAVLSFSPHVGTIGDQVTITGVGLNTASSVSFNGTPAQIVSATPSSLITLVPDGASTGLITLSGVRGTAITATAFQVVARVVISPSLAEVLPGESVGFTGTVAGTTDQRVTWSVNGIAGGNPAIGTIDANGNYSSPNINTGLTVTITATSVADTAVSSQATARILNPNTSSEVRSGLLSVGVGVSANTTFVTRPVSIEKGAPLGIESRSVSVLEGNFLFAQSHALSVLSGETLNITSHPVSAELGAPFPVAGRPVSETTGPVIAAISPGAFSRGNTLVVTITGQNLVGSTAISFNTQNGNRERNIGVSNISVSSDGMTLTFTAVVGTNAAAGVDVVYVTTPNGRSPTQRTGTNIVAIQ